MLHGGVLLEIVATNSTAKCSVVKVVVATAAVVVVLVAVGGGGGGGRPMFIY